MNQRAPRAEAWLSKTGQYWKYIVFWSLLLLSGSFFVLFVVQINNGGNVNGWYAATFTLAGAAAFTWLASTIRCSKCRRHVAWWYLTHSSAGDWLTDLERRPHCPACGHDGVS